MDKIINLALVCLLIAQQFSLMFLKEEILAAQLKILELQGKLDVLYSLPLDANPAPVLNHNACTWEGIGLFFLIAGVVVFFLFTPKSSVGNSSNDVFNYQPPGDFVQNTIFKSSNLPQNETLSKGCENTQVILDALQHLDSNSEFRFMVLDSTIFSLKSQLRLNESSAVSQGAYNVSQEFIDQALRFGMGL